MEKQLDKNIRCRRCGKYETELKDFCYEHHLIPMNIGGTDAEGRKNLCKTCHLIIHKKLLAVVWDFVADKKRAKDAILKSQIGEYKYVTR